MSIVEQDFNRDSPVTPAQIAKAITDAVIASAFRGMENGDKAFLYPEYYRSPTAGHVVTMYFVSRGSDGQVVKRELGLIGVYPDRDDQNSEIDYRMDAFEGQHPDYPYSATIRTSRNLAGFAENALPGIVQKFEEIGKVQHDQESSLKADNAVVPFAKVGCGGPK